MKTPQSKINIKKILKKSPIAHSQSDSTIIFFPKKVLLAVLAAPSSVTHSLPGCLGLSSCIF